MIKTKQNWLTEKLYILFYFLRNTGYKIQNISHSIIKKNYYFYKKKKKDFQVRIVNFILNNATLQWIKNIHKNKLFSIYESYYISCIQAYIVHQSNKFQILNQTPYTLTTHYNTKLIVLIIYVYCIFITHPENKNKNKKEFY